MKESTTFGPNEGDFGTCPECGAELRKIVNHSVRARDMSGGEKVVYACSRHCGFNSI